MAVTASRPSGSRSRALLRPLVLFVAVGAAFPASALTPDLTTLNLEQLLELTVVGASKYEQRQSEVAAAVSVITRQEIKAFGWRTLEEALASLPGVYTTYDHQYAFLGTRGFGLPGDFNTRVLVNIDGNRVNDPTFDGGPFGRTVPLDIDLVERIEFIPGPGGAVYGQNAMFGVVNVITRGSADGAELAAAYQGPGRMREGRATLSKRFDNGVNVLVSASSMKASGQDRHFDYGSSGVSGVAVGMDGQRDRKFFARIDLGEWSFEHVDGNFRKDDPTGAYRSDPLVPGNYQGDRYALTQLRYEKNLAADTLLVSARLFTGVEQYRSLLTYGTPIASPADSEWKGAELRMLSTAIRGHKVMLGVEVQDNSRLDQAVVDVANHSNDLLIARTGHRVGIYAQDEWRLFEALTATAGLRVDRNNVTGTKSSPRAALIWQATPDTTLKALYGRAHRAPNVFERDYGDSITQVANPALKGERIDTFELVADHRVSRDLAVRASIYQWSMHDLVTLGIEPVSGLSQYESGEPVKARGLELSADKTWPSGARLRGSLSVQGAKQGNAAALVNSPKVLAKANFSSPLPWEGARAGYELHYDSKRLSLDGSKLGGYALSNLTVSADMMAKSLELSLGIYNLFDKRHAHPGADTNWQNALVQDGRSVRFKVVYSF